MNVEIAQRLAEMRREKGFSQEELAEQLGLSRQAVSKWERAESSPDTGNLIALANLYGVTLDELVRADDDIADDMRFESVDRSTSAEMQAQEAAVRASEAAVQAAAAAVQAQTAAQQAEAPARTAPTSAPAPQYAAPVAPFASAPAPGTTPSVVPPSPYSVPVPPPPGMSPTAMPQAPFNSDNSSVPQKRKASPWMTFPYPILCVIVFLLAGFFFGVWHPAWVVFLTIPLYYWIAHIIENDPNYKRDR